MCVSMKIFSYTSAKKSCLRFWMNKFNRKVLRRGRRGNRKLDTAPPGDDRFDDIEEEDEGKKRALVPYRRGRAPLPPRREMLALNDYS